jgi:glucose/arabinose dehydrogenase
MRKTLLILGIGIVLVIIVALTYDGKRLPDTDTASQQQNDTGTSAVSVIIDNLTIPWEIVFLPDGDMLVTERPGRLVRISEERTVIPIAGVAHRGEGGLLGMALHPDFERNALIYLYLTTAEAGGLTNRVERYRLEGNTLVERTVIIENIPGSSFHDGGRIAFGPDGLLYITTGDAGNEGSAQDSGSLAGKILRVTADGSIPSDNPFSTAVYSYGHRNPQGLAWDSAGRLFATEHGRSGVRSGFDEVNLIVKGGNYGWPEIEGDEVANGMFPPLAHSGSDTTWAPSGAAVVGSRLFFAGLRGEALYEASLRGNEVTGVVAHLSGTYGRLRTVTLGPDGFLYLLTNNTDGRGTARSGDDTIIRIDPKTL